MYRYNCLLIAEYHDDAGVIEVVEQDGFLRLHFGSAAMQSCMRRSHPEQLCINYERTMMTLLLLNPEPSRTLMIGLGGGSLAKFLLQHNPHGVLDVVELRPLVLEVARNHFALPEDPRLHIVPGCGAQYVAQQQVTAVSSYQLIVVDAYQHSGMAPEVVSEEFFRHCHSLLSDNGVLVINVWRSEKTIVTLTRNLATIFNWRVHFIPVRGSHNLIGFAFAAGFPQLEPQRLEAEALILQQRLQLDFPDYLEDLKVSDPLGSLFIDA